MSIKPTGGVFGRNPKFNNVEVDGTFTANGTAVLNGTTIPSSETLLTTSDEGAGNGLDADTVDGNHASDFATSAQGDTADSALQNVVEDTTPQLGGNLDLNGNSFEGAATFNGSNADVDFNIKGDNGDAFFVNGANNDVNLGYEDTGTTPKLFWDASTERLGLGTTSPKAKVSVEESSASLAEIIVGNSNSQGLAQKLTVVRQIPVVSLGTKLIIPFVSSSNRNRTTICRVFGHSAVFNNRGLPSFEVTFSVGHITVVDSLAYWNDGGNVSSVGTSGMNVEINFTSAYTGATSDGVFVCLEYLTSDTAQAINISGITMN